MKQLINALIIALFLMPSFGYSQCKVQTSKSSNGGIFKYLNSEIVGNGKGCEFGVSISSNGTNYFFNTNVKYVKKAVKSGVNLIVALKNNQSLSLKLYNCQIANSKKPEIVMGVYSLTQPDLEKLKKSTIEKIVYEEVGGNNQSITLSKNFDVALRHIKCLE
jgi:hypothetical protein